MSLYELYAVRRKPGGQIALITHDRDRATNLIRDPEGRWAERFLWSSLLNAYVCVEFIAPPRLAPPDVPTANRPTAAV